MNIDLCDDIELSFNAVTPTVESANTAVLLVLNVPIVVSSFNSGCDELKVERYSFIVETGLDKDSVNCELVVEKDSV